LPVSDAAQYSEVMPPERAGCRGAGIPVGLLLLVMVGVIVYAMFWPAVNRGTGHPAVGQKLPPVELEPLTGGGQAIGPGDLAGRVVLLNFWGTWCPPCLAELPDIAEIERKFRDRGDFLLLAVSCGRQSPEDPEQLRRETSALLSGEQIDMPTYWDEGITTRLAVNEVVDLRYVPTTLLVDRSGVIRGVWSGLAEKDELEELLSQLLEEQ
jgi:cytochrome c biogenesis protein CcmG/thiol:disulfide interchange protein DsbE